MKNNQLFLIIGIEYAILSNQRTGYVSYIDSAVSILFLLASIYYGFRPESDTITVDVKDIKVETKSNDRIIL